MNKELIKELQKVLKNKGFYDGGIDGDFGPKTLAGVKKLVSDTTSKIINVAPAAINKTKETVKQIVTPAVVTPQIETNTLKGRERPLYAKKVLEDLGWKDYQAAAMVGQFMQESYFDLRTNVWGDNHSAFGIGQWRDYNGQPGRLTDLFKFAQSIGKPIDDLDTQIRFADWELKKGSEKGVGKRLAASKNIDEALEAAIGYERPRGYTVDNPRAGHGWANREKFAKSLM